MVEALDHAALLLHAEAAQARVAAAAGELRCAMAEAEAVARLTGGSGGFEASVFIRRQGVVDASSFKLTVADVMMAMRRLRVLPPPPGRSAEVVALASRLGRGAG